ncbi:hypothetical protein LOK49_LG12G02179 [Camellia lanceoleosa]|uniref:Uncharacterized protein n=1 Tax=Camellia lanceoleosa TaxID=1840588 RepID=A0ACC0FS80_9ERIC|nr:hypothetical protein LOK49_LG12G02179 [Camellia lanceoleosa]
MSSPVAPPLLVFSLRVLLSILLCSSDDTTFKGIDLENPVIDVTPSPLTGYNTSSSHGSKDVLLCERVQVAGQSRLELGSYASAYQRTLDTPLVMGPLASCLSICFLITSFKWNGPDSTITFGNSIYSANGNPWRSIGRANVRQNRAEFLSRSGMVASRGTLWNNPRRSSGWSDSPVKGMHIC